MKSQKLGRNLFFLTWPGIWLVLKLQPPRTRVIVLSEGKILLTQDWLGDGSWSLPGGGLHRNENPVAGAVREVSEETGIKISENNLNSFGVHKYRTSGITIKVYAYYVVLPKAVKPSVKTAEIHDCRWFILDELEKIHLSGSVKFLLAALREMTNLLE